MARENDTYRVTVVVVGSKDGNLVKIRGEEKWVETR